ncbi:hypothetical protein ATZ33_14645 [Enterococcus silesiacus]|uniref:WxL domain-containing protein n=1 Tax=Enterococcus silesiacus TaxID=332949 RepID=A0A0S3KE59_9ENTE|nr:isopeptide-forming domain-containing fimbrial protein [Enterococcus silesiacus]ALS02571.1 hypothetical protein ATZ33_14645 [Enterococcus silesiacus]OJG93509.1 hypothetical protein RV15_GL000111 [Enterococcus silesiacus]
MKKRKIQLPIILLLSFFFIVGAVLWGNQVSAALPSDVANANFDWRKLDKDAQGNDNIDLSTFTKVDKNTPVKLTGGAFEKSRRRYYLFFGHVGAGSNPVKYDLDTKSFNVAGNMLATLGPSQELPILGPVMIGVKEEAGTGKQQVFGYDYNYANNSVGSSGSNFDIGDAQYNALSSSWQVTRSGYTSNSMISNQRRDNYILEQYVKANEIVSYGYYGRGTGDNGSTDMKYLPVRVHGYVDNFEEGRIRYDVSFYNDSGVTTNYAMTHGSHMDVGGNHTSSRLYSNNQFGLYFDEPTSTLADKIAARIYFYTTLGYGTNPGPNDFKVGDLYDSSLTLYRISNWNAIHMSKWGEWGTGTTFYPTAITGKNNAYEAWDPVMPQGYYYNLKHPVFALRWPVLTVMPGQVGMGALDMSIEEPADIKPFTTKKYENATGVNPAKNLVGDILDFEVTALNKGLLSSWNQVTLEDNLPPELELDTESLTLIDTLGVETKLNPTVYDKATHTIKVGTYNIPINTGVTIKYKAKIISGANTTTINRFKAYNAADEKDDTSVEIPIGSEPAKPEAIKTYTNDTSDDANNRVEDTLSFELTASNTGGSVWEGVTWKDTYPKELELDKFSFELVGADGVATHVVPTFTEDPHTFEIKELDALDVAPGKQIKVRYKAKIIGGANTTIINKFEANNQHNQKAEAQVEIDVLPKKVLEKELLVEFLDKDGNKRHEPISITAKVGEFVKLKDIAETANSDLYNALKMVESEGYELVTRPLNEASVEIIDGDNRVQYIFDGKLIFVSAPPKIDFGVRSGANLDELTLEKPAYDKTQPLKVRDNRAGNREWALTVKLTTPFTTADTNSVLPVALSYKRDTTEDVLTAAGDAALITQQSGIQGMDYDISKQEWEDKNNGFKFKLEKGQTKKMEEYTATLLYTLSETK